MHFLAQLKEATIGFSGYPRLVRNPRGAFGFVATLLVILIAIHGYITMSDWRPVTAQLARQAASWPEFRIAGGQVEFAGPMPFTQTLPDGTRLVVDTTGGTSAESLTVTRGTILVTRQKLYVIQPGLSPRALDLASLQGELTKESFLQFLASRPERLLPFLYLFVYMAQLAFKAIDAAILGWIATRYTRRFRRPISFAVGFKLGLYALTLPTIIQWIWRDFSVFNPIGFTIWWSLALAYLTAGLRAYLVAVS